jgi:hypothetical protein
MRPQSSSSPPVPAGAQEPSEAPEYRIKAAFLYNFTLYTEWPRRSFAKADSPIVLAVVGDDPFGAELERRGARKTVRGRPIEVRRYGQRGGRRAVATSSSSPNSLGKSCRSF